MAKKVPPNFSAEPGPALHSARWRVGEFELDESKRELTRSGTVIELEPKPLNMLMLMLRHPGELITKNDLMEALWTGRIVTEAVLSNCAAKLRSALGADEAGVRIRTVHGYGYRLEGTPELLAADAPMVEAPRFVPDSTVPFRPNWQLKRRLGQTGETWLAEQTMTHEQRVFKFAHTPRQFSSLKREVTLYRLLRQTLEERAAVVDLLDWNFDEPPWFIEVEYCELGSLGEYLESLGGAKALPMEQRIGLVIQLADALAAVHSVGILHKDLKPANVLVVPARAGEVRLKLCDFGSGRLLDFAQLDSLAITRLGFTQLAETGGSSSSSGTPLYYAPEVLSGQPATLKADIYALGVIFYQLVVGDMRRLFAPGWEAGVNDELLREDISAAAAGDPYLRMADAQQLAQRLRQLPIRRDERLKQQAEQDAAAATLLALQRAEARRSGLLLAAAALALGLLASLGLYWQATLARREAQAATERAVTARDFVLRDVLGKLSAGDEPVSRMTVADLLSTAASQVGSRFKNEPTLEAQVLYQLGSAQVELGLATAAQTQLETAVKRGHRLLASDPAAYAQMVGSFLINELNLGNYSPRYAELDALGQQVLNALPKDDPAALEIMRARAIGNEYEGHLLQAEAGLQAALALWAKVSPGDGRMHTRLLSTLGRVQDGLGRYSEASANLEAAAQTSRSTFGPKHRRTGLMLYHQALLLIDTGHFAEANKKLDEILPIAGAWESKVSDLGISVAYLRAYSALQQQDATQIRESMAALETVLGSATDDVVNRDYFYPYLLALQASSRQQPSDSLRYLQESIDAVGNQGRGLTGSWLPGMRHLRALSLIQSHRLDEAAQVLAEMPNTCLKDLPPNHRHWGEQQRLMGLLLKAQDKPQAAAAALGRARTIYSSILGESHPRTLTVIQELSSL